MSADELCDIRFAEPFLPVRLRLANGTTFDWTRPGDVQPTLQNVHLAYPTDQDGIYRSDGVGYDFVLEATPLESAHA